MVENGLDELKVRVKLIQETVWDCEDTICKVKELLAEQESEVIRLKRVTSAISDRVTGLEERIDTLSNHEVK